MLKISVLFCFAAVLFSIKVGSSQIICSCDITKDVCDVNCCCDSDCSSSERLTFDHCKSISYSPDKIFCKYEKLSYDQFNQPLLSTQFNNFSLRCLINANYDYMSFILPDCSTSECFVSSSSSFSYDNSFKTNELKKENFSYGDYILANFGTSSGYFTVPTSFINRQCKNNPVKYLVDQTSTCTRSILSVVDSCTTYDFLQPSFYYENITISDVRLTLSSCILLNINVSCDSYPTLSEGTCQGVVKTVQYTIISTQPGKITEIKYDIVLDSISEATNFEQKFIIKHIVYEENELVNDNATELRAISEDLNYVEGTIKFSGMPGYLYGKPLIGLTYSSNSSIELTGKPGVSLTLMKPDSTGSCISSLGENYLPLLFGIDTQTQCKLSFNSKSLCKALLDYILYVFEGSNLLGKKEPVYIAAYGNFTPSFDNVISEDVVPLIKSGVVPNYDESLSVVDGCPGMIVGAHYTVAFAKVGNQENPQIKIVGVKYSYQVLNTLNLPCFDTSCLDKDHTIPLSMSVNFVDVSEEKTPVNAVLVPIVIPFPDDFLFPFFNKASTSFDRFYLTSFITLLHIIFELL